MGDHPLGRYSTCVVCGQRLSSNHKCPERVLAARLAADRRALNAEEIFRPERWARLERGRAAPQPAPALAAAGGGA